MPIATLPTSNDSSLSTSTASCRRRLPRPLAARLSFSRRQDASLNPPTPPPPPLLTPPQSPRYLRGRTNPSSTRRVVSLSPVHHHRQPFPRATGLSRARRRSRSLAHTSSVRQPPSVSSMSSLPTSPPHRTTTRLCPLPTLPPTRSSPPARWILCRRPWLATRRLGRGCSCRSSRRSSTLSSSMSLR